MAKVVNEQVKSLENPLQKSMRSLLKAFEANGFNVWKKRPIAFLAMVRTSVDGFGIEGNLAARFTSPTSYISDIDF